MPENDSRDAPSILEAIEARGVTAARLRLRDLDEATPELTDVKLRRRGRYEVHGQIAEGGVGQVLKAHDVDLNRDVALKMLRERHLEDPDILRRFIEEAQIGGQLQHPGIVPVYELGLGDDRRPYFAMKLVKGRTLAALLADRKDPSEDRRRFVMIFLAVCQTVGYAHSRGVIHRDLKSSNVMIGAFGEVQVVDWGFAKVLAQGGVADERRARREAAQMTRIATVRTGSSGSDSLAGSVLGTPAYMPPEQALGQVDDMDERSDVFALGAILCEVLTGEPPYLGSGNERLRQAAEGKLEGALSRLKASDADPGLVRIATKCLAPLRRDRPRNAGVLARGLARHLAAVEERKRKAEIAALDARRAAARTAAETAEERAEAEKAKTNAARQRAKLERNRARAERAREAAAEARRGRKRALLVASAALLVVLVGAGVTLAILGGRADHARVTEGRVDALLERAKVLQGKKQWAEAIAVLDEAESVARRGGVAEPALPGVATVRAEVEEARAKVAAADAATAADERLRVGLEAVRLGEPTEEAFVAAFEESGISPDAADAGARLARHEAIAEPVAAALDEWAWLRPRDAGRDRLIELANAIDPDATRGCLRRAAAAGNFRELRDMAAADEETPLPERTVDVLATGLLAMDQAENADAVLRRALLRFPGSPWLNVRRARALMRLPIPRPSDAARHLESTIALRPDCPGPRVALEALRRKGTDLEAFRAVVGYKNATEWFTVDLTWSRITGRRRLIYANKAAVTRALDDYRDEGIGDEANPVIYRAGTFFVAESFDREGKLFQTEALQIGVMQGVMRFFVFDGEGRRTNRFFRHQEMAPRVCASCHLAEKKGFYPPMMDFPTEPEESRIDIEDRYRNKDVVLKFKEGKHCGSNLFGPYGAIWLSMLLADDRAGTVKPEDQTRLAVLRRKYDYLFGK